MANRGLMAENMFIGQSALLQWLNSTLGLKMEKIEDVSGQPPCFAAPFSAIAANLKRHLPYDRYFSNIITCISLLGNSHPPLLGICLVQTCSGAVACQLMDCLHPGSVNMKKLDFNVRSDWEYVTNYKELQQSFNKVGVDRAFNVSQLSKGKRQDSIEFMQWFKGYWDSVTGGQDIAAEYDGVARRALCKTGDWKKVKAPSLKDLEFSYQHYCVQRRKTTTNETY